MTLTGKQKRALRALGHALKPVVQIGREGLLEPQADAVRRALADHELIKVRLGRGAPLSLDEMIEGVEALTGAVCVQRIGKLGLFYLPDPESPRIVLPPGGGAEDGADG